MRIAVNASILGKEATGTHVYTLHVLRELLALPELASHEVTLFTPMKIESLPAAVKQRVLPSFLGRSALGVGNAVMRFLWNQVVFTQIGKRFDRVYCPTYNSSLWLKNQVVTIHDLIAMRYPWQHPLQHRFCKRALPILLRNARSVVTISAATKAEIDRYYAIPSEKITVVHNGCDPQMAPVDGSEAQTKSDAAVLLKHDLRSYLLAVGATLQHKNLQVILDAFALLPEDSQLELAIVGGASPYREKLRAHLTGKPYAHRVRFLGYVPDASLPALYRRAQMLAYPSLCEGFGLPIVDAMACGCPVLCSNASSLPEVAGDAAILLDPRKPEDWASAMEQVLGNPELRTNLAKLGYDNIKRFSWNATARQIADLILS